ncbi:hypothetical protein WMY93_011405 [Mugilogobius chulae]|uniref:t-SNARE coiled-coil homology domain-containing protein n=1 Tax=Mugilogobius chulae TaxID=88201 RepID=A0AAW0PCJ8_9GOBI
MATRRLTDAFLLMRNNAIQNRQILAEQVSTYEPRLSLSTRSNAAELDEMFHRCQRAVTGLQTRCGHCTEQEERLLRNVVSSLAQSLQDLSTNFRHTQSGYLKRMKNREERSKHFFDSGLHDDQLMLVEQNSVMVQEREREIRNIVQSISDLNEIFRDLATMVVEQGTVLDRIDFNVEQACVKTEDGLKQLQKAEQYQKKNRKMLVILILFVIVVVLILILFGTKF